MQLSPWTTPQHTYLPRLLNISLYFGRYKENMIRAGNLFRDRPRSPMEESLWWVDYVLRSNDTSHLRPLGRHQYWFQRRALDVWFFTFVILVGIKVIVVSLLKQFVYYFINLSQKLRIYASLQRVKLE